MKIKPRSRKIINRVLSAAAIGVLLFFPARMFHKNLTAAALSAAAGGLMLSAFPGELAEALKLRLIRRELLQLIQILLGELNRGNTLPVSLARASKLRLGELRGRRFARGYQKLIAASENNLPFSFSADLLCEMFPAEEAIRFFNLIRQPERLGRSLVKLFRNFEIGLREADDRRRSLAADRGRTLSELLSLTAMPILFIFFLNKAAEDFMRPAYLSARGSMLLSLAFFFFLASLWFFRQYLSDLSFQSRDIKPPEASYRLRKKDRGPLFPKLIYAIMRRLRGTRADRAVDLLFDEPDEELRLIIYARLLASGLRPVIYISILMLIAASQNISPRPLVFLLPLLFIYPTYRLVAKAEALKENLQSSLPSLFTYLGLCLTAGCSIYRAFSMAEQAFPKPALLHSELNQLNRRLMNRAQLSEALEHFGRKIDFPEASAYLSLLERISHGGGKDEHALLELQNSHFKHVLAERRRKRSAARSNRFLIPMLLDLLAVLCISLAPVIEALKI